MAFAVSIPDELTEESAEVRSATGPTPAVAINVFAKRVVRDRAIPFGLEAERRDPDRRMRESEAEPARSLTESYEAMPDGKRSVDTLETNPGLAALIGRVGRLGGEDDGRL